MITAKIDIARLTGTKIVTGKSGTNTYLDITNARLFKGKTKDGHTPYYLDLALIETKQSSFGDYRDENTHMVCEGTTKEERAANKRGAILGNAQDRSKRRTNDQQPTEPGHLGSSENTPADDTDLPF